jgi:hypothetical protein
MMHAAFLVGISTYPDHTLPGVPNDLDLLVAALRSKNYSASSIHVFNDTHTTQQALHHVFAQIQLTYREVDEGCCFVYIGASGTLSLEPLVGGVLPSDGNVLDFTTTFPFAAVNRYLTLGDGIRVEVVVDT